MLFSPFPVGIGPVYSCRFLSRAIGFVPAGHTGFSVCLVHISLGSVLTHSCKGLPIFKSVITA